MLRPVVRCALVLSVVVTLAGSLAVAPTIATAQVAYEPRDLTRGVETNAAVAGDHDANAVALNPGGLGTLGGASIAFTFTELSARSLVGGGGWALSLAVPLVLRLPSEGRLSLTYGFGFQSLDSPDSFVGPIAGGENQDGSYLLNSVAIGTEQLGIGYTVGTFFWTDTPQDQSILTHHLGLSLRPVRFLAAGLTIRDIFEPVGRGPAEQFARSFDAELMVRPLGDWRLEIGGGVTAGSDDLIDVRARAIVKPLPGITAFARYESVERRYAVMAEPTRDNRFLAGITIDGIDGLLGRDQPSVSASYAALASSETDKVYAGSVIAGHYSGERVPPVIEQPRVESLSFETALSDREHVRRLLYLRRAERAGDIAGFVITLGAAPLGYGHAAELREAIERLRRAGKQIVVYLRAGGMPQVYVASAADRVVLHPTVSLALTGVAAQVLYFGQLLARLGVEVDVLKIGEYKSAPESFTRNSATGPAREQLQAYVDDVAQTAVAAIAAGRSRPVDEIRGLLSRPVIAPPEALSLGLVDDLGHPDELEAIAKKTFGREVEIVDRSTRPVRPRQWAFPRIAVIHIDGDITPGPSVPSIFGAQITGDDIADAIRDARESDEIRAIVLRINSPGGAVQPSERIAREVELTRGKKPIVVSMGDVAASGGYMAAAHGDLIFAPPTALTGSIGIFAIKLDLDRLIARLGVSVETVKVGDHADADSAFRPWTDDERAAKDQELRYLYDRFVALVAAGRKLDKERVDALGRGRIWSGSRAKSNQLVDQSAGFLEAVDEARRRTRLPSRTEVRVVQLPLVKGGVLGQLFGVRSLADAAARALPPHLRNSLTRLPAVLWWGSGNLARLDWVAP